MVNVNRVARFARNSINVKPPCAGKIHDHVRQGETPPHFYEKIGHGDNHIVRISTVIPQEYLKTVAFAQGVSENEWQVLSLALEGNSINAIAAQLNLRPDATRKRLGEIYKKFGIKGLGSGKLAKLQQQLFAQYQAQVHSESSVVSSPVPDRRPKSVSLAAQPDNPTIEWWNAPDLRDFYGRELELKTLSQAILANRCSLVSIIGLKGIGKTALALQSLEQLAPAFERVIWCSLDERTWDLGEWVNACLLRHTEDASPPLAPEDAIAILMETCRTHRLLLVLDGYDILLDPADSTCAIFSDLLQRFGAERHRSCLLLTSRENPQALVTLADCGHPVYTLSLAGLAPDAAEQILTNRGLQDTQHWPELIRLFQGNPLALQLIAMRIQRFFQGQVGEFLKQETLTLAQIDDLVFHQVQGLSRSERSILYWLVLADQSLDFADLRQRAELSGATLLTALEALLRRSLIQGESKFTVEPLVHKYIRHHLAQEHHSETLPTSRSEILDLLNRCLVRGET
jgi:hypothetical protein